MTVRDFVSGSMAFVVAAFVAGAIHHERIDVRAQDHASVKGPRTHPIAALATALAEKKPVQAGINCFGTTLASFGVGTVPRFATDDELEAFLASSCRQLDLNDSVANFDVGVIYDATTMDAAHSFVVVGRGRAFYKDGVEANTAFEVGPVVPMFEVFRVGYSRNRCDEIASNAMVESGLPCPGVVKRYRCKTGQTRPWPQIEKIEEIVFGRLAWKKTMTESERKAVVDALVAMSSAPSLTLPKAPGEDGELYVQRLQSLESFFTYYADRNIWGETTIGTIRNLLRGIVLELKR